MTADDMATQGAKALAVVLYSLGTPKIFCPQHQKGYGLVKWHN